METLDFKVLKVDHLCMVYTDPLIGASGAFKQN